MLGSPPPELEALIERRRRAGVDHLNEVWQGVLHMVPGPTFEHAQISQQLAEQLGPLARAAGLAATISEFNLGESEQDFRVPDGGLHRPGASGVWLAAALVLEILAPGDETWDKLPFYAAHDVEEIVIVDPSDRKIAWLGLRDGEYHPLDRSLLIETGPAELAERLDWPQASYSALRHHTTCDRGPDRQFNGRCRPGFSRLAASRSARPASARRGRPGRCVRPGRIRPRGAPASRPSGWPDRR